MLVVWENQSPLECRYQLDFASWVCDSHTGVCWKQPEIRDGPEMALSLLSSGFSSFCFVGVGVGVKLLCLFVFTLALGLCGDLFWSFSPEVLPFLKPAPRSDTGIPSSLFLCPCIFHSGGRVMAGSGSPWGLRAGVTLWSPYALQADFPVGVT